MKSRGWADMVAQHDDTDSGLFCGCEKLGPGAACVGRVLSVGVQDCSMVIQALAQFDGLTGAAQHLTVSGHSRQSLRVESLDCTVAAAWTQLVLDRT
jgi:hypothetical protein